MKRYSWRDTLTLRSAPPHTRSPGPFGPGTPEESEKSPERVPWRRGPKVPKECAPESQKSPKRVRKSGFRLFLDSFETPGRTLWALLGPCPGVLFPDSFRTLPGFWARKARETLCGAGPIATLTVSLVSLSFVCFLYRTDFGVVCVLGLRYGGGSQGVGEDLALRPPQSFKIVSVSGECLTPWC